MATLTASVSQTIQENIRMMWDVGNQQNVLQWSNPVKTVAKMLATQKIRFNRVLDDHGRCVALKIWFWDLSGVHGTAAYMDSTPDDGTCADFGTCQTVGTLAKTYNPNLFGHACFSVDDNLCANDAAFARLSAEGLNAKMLEIRKALNIEAIQFLNTNASANVDTIYTDNGGTGEFTINGTATEVPAASWANPDILMKIQHTAVQNRIPENGYVIFDGTNLYLEKALAPYLGLNDDNRSYGALFADLARNYVADNYDLVNTTESADTFIANPAMYGFFNQVKYPRAPIVLDTALNMQGFSIPDPFLKYNRVEIDANGNVVGESMAPVEYDVLYKKACGANDAKGFPTWVHSWDIRFTGGLVLGAPGQAPNHINGILKFTKIAGI
jgi:hypothetical protein